MPGIKLLPPYLITLFSLLLAPSIYGIEIFRSEDISGRIIYSDKANQGIKPVKLPNRTYRHLQRVKKVYDGDTIILENDQRVRLLGINTPEIESRHRADEPGGKAAKTWLTEQIRDQKIYLEFDLEKRDKYKRLLAHVFLNDGTHINLELIKNGLAFVSIIPPNLRYANKFSRAQKQAEQNKIGLWKLPRYQAQALSKIVSNNRGWRRYIGIPKTIKSRQKYTYLIFDERTNIRIVNDHLNNFPDLATYVGKTIEIRGWVSRRNGKFSMHIRHPSAIIEP